MTKWCTCSSLTLLSFIIFIEDTQVAFARGYKGTHGLTEHTWEEAFISEKVNGGLRYLQSAKYRLHPEIMPTICKNDYNKKGYDTLYNIFVCPKWNESDSLDHCCGDADREYCCEYEDNTLYIASFVGGILFLFVFGTWCRFKTHLGRMCRERSRKRKPSLRDETIEDCHDERNTKFIALGIQPTESNV